MVKKTIVLRKEDHWYIISSQDGDESKMLLTLLEYSQKERYNIEPDEVYELLDRLGWEVEVYDRRGAA